MDSYSPLIGSNLELVPGWRSEEASKNDSVEGVAAAVALGLMYTRIFLNDTINILRQSHVTHASKGLLLFCSHWAGVLAPQTRSRIGIFNFVTCRGFISLWTPATLEDGGHVSHCRVPFDHRLRLLSHFVMAFVCPNIVFGRKRTGQDA